MLTVGRKNIQVDDLETLLKSVRSNTFGYLHDIVRRGSNIMCTCPFHGQHKEKHPSCGVNNDTSSKDFGVFNCFTCGEKGYITKFIAKCFNSSAEVAEKWLLDNYLYTEDDSEIIDLPEIILDSKKERKIKESKLNSFEAFHPYMNERKLDLKVLKEFDVKYDASTKCLIFPVRDYNGNIVMFTRRSVVDKRFIIDSGVEKPVYLLYYWMQKGVTEVMLTEGQIDALTACSYGFPCCATMGQPSDKQIEDINKSGIRVLYLMFDNDAAGKRFTQKVKARIRKDIIVVDVSVPYKNKKDINDLTKEQFYNCIELSSKNNRILV